MMDRQVLGVNLSFAVKRWPEPERWAAIVRQELGLTRVQFSFDLLDPWWPRAARAGLVRRTRAALEDHGLTLDGAFIGLAAYTYSALAHPEPALRAVAQDWWARALDLAAELGAPAVGGPLGALSVADAADPERAAEIWAEVPGTVHALAERARAAGVGALLVEPTPLRREWPHTPEQAADLARALAGSAVPLRFVLDLGHALFRPLYGGAGLEPWLDALAGHLHGLHLQQTDGLLDRHWGFTRPGVVDLPALRAALAVRGLAGLPLVLEVFHPFEEDEAVVLDDLRVSVRACRVLEAPAR